MEVPLEGDVNPGGLEQVCACLPGGEMRLVLQLNGLPLACFGVFLFVCFLFGWFFFVTCSIFGQCSEVRMRKRKAIHHHWVKVGVEGSL